EYNIEGNPFEAPLGDYPGMLELTKATRPAQVTFVPDSVDQLTSNRGWVISPHEHRLRDTIAEYRALGGRVSMFMDPEVDEYALAKDVGADRIELYTEDFARAHKSGHFDETLQRYAAAAKVAQDVGLGVNAGHDLSLTNLHDFLTIDGILEVSIGHAVISDALRFGLTGAVTRYLDCL
ncbi:MAG: pyridoxine 5'-phosphate synthase, partial [Pseudomonadota bacterium]